MPLKENGSKPTESQQLRVHILGTENTCNDILMQLLNFEKRYQSKNHLIYDISKLLKLAAQESQVNLLLNCQKVLSLILSLKY